LRLAARGGMSHAALPEEVRQRDKLQFIGIEGAASAKK